MIDLTLAQARVASMKTAESWYRGIFGCPPDSRPMDGLIEWRFGPHHGVQVFLDPDGAGSSTLVLGVADLGTILRRADEAGIAHTGEQPGGGGSLVVLTDPDGNQVVLLDPRAAHGAVDGQVHQATLRFNRFLPAGADRVWEAFAQVERRRAWSVPEGQQVEYDAHDFRVGGVDEYRCGPAGDLSNHVTTRYVAVDAPHAFVATTELRRDGRVVGVDTTHWRLWAAGEAAALRVDVQVTSLTGVRLLEGYRTGHERTLDHLERWCSR